MCIFSGHPVVCPYGIVDETHTAIIEMSGAAGAVIGGTATDTDNKMPAAVLDCIFDDFAYTVSGGVQRGVQGCSAIYGPQKGATSTMILQMDKWLSWHCRYA